MTIQMRQDLADEGYTIPAFDDVLPDDEYVGEHYISAHELQGATLEGNAPDDSDNRYWYTRLRLADGRLLYFIGIDLDF